MKKLVLIASAFLASSATAEPADKYLQACWNLGRDTIMSVLNANGRKNVGYREGVIDAIQWGSPGEICALRDDPRSALCSRRRLHEAASRKPTKDLT
jgi:hypothetical protein